MSLRPICLRLVTFLAFATSVFAQPAPLPVNIPARPAQPPGEEMYGPTKLPDVDIDTMLGLLEILTGRAILRPATLPTAQYNVMLPAMPKSDVIRAIETVLELNNIAVIPVDDKFMKVVQLANARNEAPQMIAGTTLDMAPSGRVATKIFMLDFLRAQEWGQIQNSISTPGIGPQGTVVLPAANAVMVTDTISNLQRIEMLLKEVDRPMTSGLKPKFYPLKHAKASDTVNKIRGFLSPSLQAQLGTATTFNHDDRTNQIVLIADPRQHAFFDDLIAKLDVKADPNTRNEVIYLKHAEAAPVQQLLSLIISGQTSNAQRSGAAALRPGQGIQTGGPGIQPGQPGQPVQPGQPQPVTAQQTAAVLPPGVTTGTLGGTSEFSSIITIGSDARSNAIIVSGTVDDIRLIRELIDKLDVLLAQVRIEVIVAEVTLSDTDRTGISALGLTVKTDTPATGDGGHGTHITEFAGTVAGWAITSGVVNPLSFNAAFADAGNRSNLRVLQAPTITTTHGKAGQVTVGQKIPVISSVTSAPSTGAGSGFQTQESVTPVDVSLELIVKPFIGDDGSVQLEIDQKVDDVIGNVTVNGNPQPIIGTRKAKSFINVYDGEMIVLGGLQRNTLANDRRKLGFIREIPILSHLFGDRTRRTERTELLIFVRPRIIPRTEGTADTDRTIDQLSNRKQIREFLEDPSKPPREGPIERFK